MKNCHEIASCGSGLDRLRIVGLGALLSLYAFSVAASAIGGLDLATGNIDGDQAIAFFPSSLDSGDLLDSSDCVAHLWKHDSHWVIEAYPAGRWVLPDRGHYRVFLECPGLISPYSPLFGYPRSPFSGAGTIGFVPVVPAGNVTSGGLGSWPGSPMMWLLSASPFESQGHIWPELVRLETPEEIEAGVQMPAGLVIAAVWDPGSRQFLALSRPIEVRRDRTSEVRVDSPARGGDVVVRLQIPSPDEGPYHMSRRSEFTRSTVAYLSAPGVHRREPDVVVPTANSYYGIWYGISAGPAVLRAGSESYAIPTTEFAVSDRSVVFHAARMQARPRLTVELDLPALLEEEETAVEVLEVEQERLPPQTGDEEQSRHRPSPPVEVVALEAGQVVHTFDRLPMARLDVVLETGYGSKTERVDLRNGQDQHLVLSPDVFVLEGTVFRGGEPHQAVLEFSSITQSTTSVSTNSDGTYEAILVEPVRFISVAFEDQPPFRDFFPHAIDSSREMDFHLTDDRILVQVMDATNGQGIPDARLSLVLTYTELREIDEEETEVPKTLTQNVETDRAGEAVLPPLQEGELEIRVYAEGYVENLEIFMVGEPATPKEVQIALSPTGPTGRLDLRLPDGRAASGARVWLIEPSGPRGPLFEDQAGTEGEVEVPEWAEGGRLLVNHPEAAFASRTWKPGDDHPTVWELSARAPSPLRIQVVDESGEPYNWQSKLLLWIDGRPVTGLELALATSTRGVTSRTGTWEAANLPAELSSLAVTAWRTGEPPPGESRATPIDLPWAPVVRVPVAK